LKRLFAAGKTSFADLAVAMNNGAASEPPIRVANDDLQEAALRGDLGLVRRLIHFGASVNAPIRPESEDEYMSLLHILACKPEMPNGTRIISEMLTRKAGINVRSSVGATPLSCACLSRHIGAVEVLLEAKADPAVIDDYGRKAMTCAVLPWKTASTNPELCVEVISLLVKAGADLNDGGDVSPIVEAVRLNNAAAVSCLLKLKATPNGIHEAVQKAPVPIIESLVRAEANPFVRNEMGKSVMDVALARGNEEVTTLLRDYIGDLQRQQHAHLKTLEESMRDETMEQDHLFSDRATGGRRSLWEIDQSVIKALSETKTWEDKVMEKMEVVSRFCRKLNRHQAFQTVMMAALFLALFLPDFWVIFDIASNDALDVMLIIIFVIFITEFVVLLIGLRRGYLWTFFFWMDLIGILSVPLDHSLVTNALPVAADNAVLMRAARMAKLGARAGRFSKLVKLLQYLPGMQQQGQVGTVKVLSGMLNVALSTRVSCLIIVMIMILPLFDLATYPENDFSMKMWAEAVTDTASFFPASTGITLTDFEDFYSSKSYFPYEISYAYGNGTSAWQKLSVTRSPPRREQNKMEVEVGSTKVMFNVTEPRRFDAACTCMLVTTIMLLIVSSSIFLSNVVTAIVILPLERLLLNVQQIASSIFSSVNSMAEEHARGSKVEMSEVKQEELDDIHTTGGNAFGGETELLEKVLNKIAILSEMAMKKSPLDADTLDQLGVDDRAVLQCYSGELLEAKDEANMWDAASIEDEETDQRVLATTQRQLAAHNVSWENFEDWNFCSLDVGSGTQRAVCLSILTLRFSRLGVGSQLLDSGEWGSCCSSFVEAMQNGYTDPSQAPYHNFTHAVDATLSMHHMLNVNSTEHYFSPLERFALVLSASAHDIGHPGVNNIYLVETADELALRYNDHSPLENMHCARLFELTRHYELFEILKDVQYREVRAVCVDAILHTDFRHHFSMVKELQTYYDMNADLFDTSEEMYRLCGCEFPSKEAAEFFRGHDVRKHLRNIFLHFCDISNPMKQFSVAQQWAGLIIDEFFRQGDKEKENGVPVQALNDRSRVSRPYSQVGFIEIFVAPLTISMEKLFPKLIFCSEVVLINLETWYEMWVEEASPDEEEQAKVADRIVKLSSSQSRNKFKRTSL